MKEVAAFLITVIFSLALVTYLGSKRKKRSRYERHQPSDWQKLDRGIDPSE